MEEAMIDGLSISTLGPAWTQNVVTDKGFLTMGSWRDNAISTVLISQLLLVFLDLSVTLSFE